VVRIPSFLAEGEVYHSHGGASQYLVLFVAAAIVLLAIVGLYLWNTSRKPRNGGTEEASSEDILTELCRAHELSRAEQALIVAAARNSFVAQPAALFIDPGALDRAAETADPDAPRYRALRQKLFASVV
jgi:hypothetical protein